MFAHEVVHRKLEVLPSFGRVQPATLDPAVVSPPLPTRQHFDMPAGLGMHRPADYQQSAFQVARDISNRPFR